jgi:hypothetical protein
MNSSATGAFVAGRRGRSNNNQMSAIIFPDYGLGLEAEEDDEKNTSALLSGPRFELNRFSLISFLK